MTEKADYLNPGKETPAAARIRNQNHHTDEFILLGYNHGIYYYLPRGSRQVVALKARAHVEAELIDIAPKKFWDKHYGNGDGHANWKLAQDDLIRRQQIVGLYDPSRIRGRGAWWEDGHSIVHIGNKLIIEGKEYPLNHAKENIYEIGLPFHINYKNPLSIGRARKLLDLCDMVSWEKPINAKYLAGWIALAPICGALDWRPHIWLTGPSCCGKTTIVNEVVKRILASVTVGTQSGATEAAIRQSLNSDARPVIYDEAETKEPESYARMKSILRLVRASSTKGAAPITKGGADGIPSYWYINSMFLFSSISYCVSSPEDARRITPLAIIKDGNIERYARLVALIGDTLTESWVSGLMARSIKMIPVIRANSHVFGGAVSAHLTDRGAGDQIGPLLAGAWSLYSDSVISAEDAAKWIKDQEQKGAWTEHKAQIEDTDEAQCLARLMQHVLRVQVKYGVVDRSIAELLEIATSKREDSSVSTKDAIDVAGRHGFRADEQGILVSVSHAGIAAILRDTPWARNWARTLRRLPKAHATDWGIRFGAVKTRGIEIPWSLDDTDSASTRQITIS